MKSQTVLLVNPNRMRPPIAPVALDYLAAALQRAGYEPVLCDLTFEEEWAAALQASLKSVKPLAVVVTIRNLDDAYFASQDFILERTRAIIRQVIDSTEAPVVLGGVGFSIAPKAVLTYTKAHYGILGEGEQSLCWLLDTLSSQGDVTNIPGLVFRTDDKVRLNRPVCLQLETWPTPARRFVDNPRYFREGGQLGIETKRGCDNTCVYCVEPAAQGRMVRLRSPESVVAEMEDLLEQSIDVYHWCDSEFNLPPCHLREVCRAIRDRGLADKIRWYAYGYPQLFNQDLVDTVREAGCVGINFGVDHVDPGMLKRLGRSYAAADIRITVDACKLAGITVMFDMLFGGQGETRNTMAEVIRFMQAAEVDRVGLSCGIRVYPNTPLAAHVKRQGSMKANPELHGAVENNDDFLRPVFYVEPTLGTDIHGIVTELVAGDKRFLHADPAEREGNYNYNDNTVLEAAIHDGARGAYWDILRKLS